MRFFDEYSGDMITDIEVNAENQAEAMHKSNRKFLEEHEEYTMPDMGYKARDVTEQEKNDEVRKMKEKEEKVVKLAREILPYLCYNLQMSDTEIVSTSFNIAEEFLKQKKDRFDNIKARD